MSLYENPTSDGRPNFYMGGTQVDKTNNHRVFFLADAAGVQPYKAQNYLGYMVSLEWVGTESSPCMVIWPERTSLADGLEAGEFSAWCISRRAITEFVGFTTEGKCTGEATAHCIQEAREALPVLGKGQGDEQALSALVDAVVTFAPELLLMPVTPNPANEPAFPEVA